MWPRVKRRAARAAGRGTRGDGERVVVFLAPAGSKEAPRVVNGYAPLASSTQTSSRRTHKPKPTASLPWALVWRRRHTCIGAAWVIGEIEETIER